MQEEVAALEVGEFVEEDEAQFRIREPRANVLRQDERGAEQAHDRRALDLRAFDEARPAMKSEFASRGVGQFHQPGIADRRRLGDVPGEAAVNLPGEQKKSRRARQPGQGEEGAEGERVCWGQRRGGE